MKFVLILCFGVSLTFGSSAAWADDCETLGQQMREQAKTASYEEFEQAGWRTLASKDCFFQSGQSIISWLSAHLDTASPEQIRTMRYQAARVFAMTGRSSVALVHLGHSKNPDQAADAPQNWNAYIDAFTAWLKRDIKKLRVNIERLEAQEVDADGFKPNLIAARRFLACFNSSYSDIETDPACLKAAEKMDEETETNLVNHPPSPVTDH